MASTGALEHGEAIVPGEMPGTVVGDAPSALTLTAGKRWERTIDTAVVVILAVASLLAAWGGHQAGLWNSEQTEAIAQAESKQVEATRATTIGYQEMQFDVAMELNWLRATREGDTDLAAFYESRFSPHLSRAFAAWMATNPLVNPNASEDPFGLPEYQIPQLQAAAGFDEDAHRAFAEGERAGAIGDTYVLATMLLAVVLFFAGVCTKIGWRPAQMALLGLSLLLLLFCVHNLGGLPDGSDLGLTPLWD